MLDLGRYLLGVAEIAILVGFAWLGGAALRRRLLPDFDGAPAHLAAAVLGLAILLWTAELLGSVGFFQPLPYLALTVVAGLGLRVWLGGGRGAPPPRWVFRLESRRLAVGVVGAKNRTPLRRRDPPDLPPSSPRVPWPSPRSLS